MYLRDVSIENFRIFQKLNIRFNNGINGFVGENNSGKTALIDAVRYTLGSNSGERIWIQESDFHENKSSFAIRLSFSNISAEEASPFVEHLSYSADGKPELHITLRASKTDKTRNGYRYIDRKVTSGINEEKNIEGEIRDFLGVTYLKPLRDAEQELSSGRGSRLSQILQNEQKIKENAERIIGYAETMNQSLKNDGAISAVNSKINRTYLSPLLFANQAMEASVSINQSGTHDSKLRQILEKLELKLDGNGEQGLGYKNLLFMATELLLLKQEGEISLPLLLIEEPEAHLHPQIQMKLLEFLSDQGVQVLLSTHSPNLASKIPVENLFLMSQGKAFSLAKTETGLKPDDYNHVSKFLDVTKSNLFFAKGVLVVEGWAEEILLPTIAKLLGRPLEKYAVSVVNVGSTGLQRFSNIFLRKDKDNKPDEWIPIPVACVRDRDKKPEETVREWKTEYDKQKIRLFVSPDKTLEYDLLKTVLVDECIEIIKVLRPQKASDLTKPNPITNEWLQSTYELVEKHKSEFSLQLAAKLEKQLKDKINAAHDAMKSQMPTVFAKELKEKLPEYLVNAIAHVTEPFVEEEDEPTSSDN